MSKVQYDWEPATEPASLAIRGQIASGDIKVQYVGGSLHVGEYRMRYGGEVYRALIGGDEPTIDWTTAEFERGLVRPEPLPPEHYDEVPEFLLERYPYEPASTVWKSLGEVELERLGDNLTHTRVYCKRSGGVKEEDYIHGKTRYRKVSGRGPTTWWQAFPMPEPDPRDDRPIESFESWQKQSEETRRELKRREGRRFHACRRSGDMRAVIEAIPMDHERKRELLNLNALLLRMVILSNDGGPLSESNLASF